MVQQIYSDAPEQPVDLPHVGDTHFVGDFLLRCSQVGGKYATVWEVYSDKLPLGEIRMRWDCFWECTLSNQLFGTPQEAVSAMSQSPQGYSVVITKDGKPYSFQWTLTKGQILANLAMDFSETEIAAAKFTPLSPEVAAQVEKKLELAWDNY